MQDVTCKSIRYKPQRQIPRVFWESWGKIELRLILRFLQFPVSPLNSMILPAKFCEQLSATSNQRNDATPWKQEQ
jgi:hypothetical protein